jgi:hypothetical protein
MGIRDDIIKDIELRLGGGMVDVELDSAHYDLAVNSALRKYRQRSQRGTQEKFVPLTIHEEQQEYQLPMNVVLVRDVIMRQTGTAGTSGSGVDFEPFNTLYLNNMLLQNSNSFQGLLNYELYADRRELLARMFGGYVTFDFRQNDKKIFLHRKFRGDDVVFVWCWVERDDEDLLLDPYASPWLRDYAFARAKFMLGEARSKFASIAGPQGGTSLNGDALKAEAQSDLDKLEEDLKLFTEGGTPYGFIIG